MIGKKIILTGALGLALLLPFNPVMSSAATPEQTTTSTVTNSDITPEASQYLSNYMVQYNDVIVPPSTYYYNKDGWTGTLRLRSYQQYPTTGITQAYYYGYISCTGFCG